MTHVPPHDLDAEQSLLGAMMVNPQACDLIMDAVQAEDFYRESHATVFRKAMALRVGGKELDVVSLCAAFTDEELKALGGRGYVCHMVDTVPSAANALNYAEIVRDMALRRKLIRAGQEIIEVAYENVDAEEAADTCEALLGAAARRENTDGLVPMPELVRVAEARMYDAAHGKKTCGRETHLRQLNEIVGGLEASSYVVLAARPSMGKSIMAMNIARHFAEDSQVLFFSVEMSKEELIDRMLAAEAAVGLSRIRTGGITQQDEQQLFKALEKMAGLNLAIDDSVSTMREIQRRTRRFAQKKKLGLVVIDYIQLLTMGHGSVESRYADVSQISRAIKLMAREHKVPVLAVSQLNRPDTKFQSEDATQPRPTLASLRESGAIEQDADQVWFIYRKKLGDVDNVELIVEKSRNSATGTVKLKMVPHFMKFIE